MAGIKEKDGRILVTIAVAADLIGVTRQYVNRWVNENKFPKVKGRGTSYIDLGNFLQQRERQMDEKNGELPDTARKLKAEADYKTSKARQEELNLMQMLGELIPQEQVQEELSILFTEIRQTLLQLPTKIKSRVHVIEPQASNDCAEVANGVIQDILHRLAKSNDTKGASGVGKKS